MENYFLILYRKGKFGSYRFCYNAGESFDSVRKYWEINEKLYEIVNMKKIPDNKVDDFKKFIKNKKSLRFNYTDKIGYTFLEKFNVNFWH